MSECVISSSLRTQRSPFTTDDPGALADVCQHSGHRGFEGASEKPQLAHPPPARRKPKGAKGMSYGKGSSQALYH